MTSYSDAETDEITESMSLFRELGVDEKNIDYWAPSNTVTGFLNTMGSRNVPGDGLARNPGPIPNRNWMIFYSGRPAPKEAMNGDRGFDAARGINHYILGQDRGIVKTIQLERTPAPMLKELRYVQSGYDGLLQLLEVYDVNISAFLIPNTFPGQIIFVDPRGFAPSTSGFTSISEDDPKKSINVDKYELSRYGIGGYYLIYKASHRIAEGERTTQISARWLHGHEKSNADPDAGDMIDKDITSNPEMDIKKCHVRKVEQPGGTATTAPPDGRSITSNPTQ